MERSLKKIEHGANIAVHVSDSRFWNRWLKNMRECKSESSYRRLEQLADEQRVTESYDNLLFKLKQGYLKDFK